MHSSNLFLLDAITSIINNNSGSNSLTNDSARTIRMNLGHLASLLTATKTISGIDILIFKDFDAAKECQTQLLEQAEINESQKNKLHENLCFFSFPALIPFEKKVFDSELFFSFYQALLKLRKFLDLVSHEQNSKNLQHKVLITDYISLRRVIPQLDELPNESIEIKKGELLAPEQLVEYLNELGYQRYPSISGPGTFAQKAEILDIFPPDLAPLRINYFDDEIESIVHIDSLTGKRIKDSGVEKVELATDFRSLLNEENSNNLRERLDHSNPKFRQRYDSRKRILQSLSHQSFFDELLDYFPLLFKTLTTLSDVLVQFCEKSPGRFRIFSDVRDTSIEHIQDFKTQLDSWQNDILEDEEDHNAITKKELFYDIVNTGASNDVGNFIDIFFDPKAQGHEFDYSCEALSETIKRHLPLSLYRNIEQKHTTLRGFLGDFSEQIKNILLIGSHQQLEQFKNFDISSVIAKFSNSHINHQIPCSMFDESGEQLYLALGEFLPQKIKKTAREKKSKDLFAVQFSSLKENDYVIHKRFGIALYRGLETLDTNGFKNDFLVLEFKDRDKVYVPTYRTNLIQKYRGSDADLKLDDLKHKRFENEKSKAKKSIKKLAFDLIKLEAERKTVVGHQFDQPGDDFSEFEEKFPFKLTPDQQTSLTSILKDMTSDKPMDRLLCGDVGFGKTEVAMRAAYLAVLGKKQVAVLVPTTILSLQHYMNFIKRFEGTGVNIEFISRLKKPAEVRETLEKLSEGQVDIIIGTHKLLGSEIQFSDLGLLVIDEEHRFGVNHKEKLKTLKANIDTLTLTATPIPRTLQLSYIGIREVSLIQTPPPMRQSIYTRIIRKDKNTIKSAIETELKRGGQVFYIHNRVHDIEMEEFLLRELVPRARIVVGHGQMNEKDLEKRIKDFFDHKYDILLATTIVESGIDIPTANTMIVNDAHKFGLAQLHQLRGRIGRSSQKAFAYFMVPGNIKLKGDSQKRLDALQKYSDIGSGFALASTDLEIRGAGSILGADQSGHIEKIGLELYGQLLDEAVKEIKGETDYHISEIDMQGFFPAFIPEWYMEDTASRLKVYKEISNSTVNEDIDEQCSEILDIYGTFPEAFENFVALVKLRNQLAPFFITSFRISKDKITLVFDQDVIVEQDQVRKAVLQLIQESPKRVSLSADFKLVYRFKEKVDESSFFTSTINLIDRLNQFIEG